MTKESGFTSPSLEEAKQLYDVAMRVKELAPWTWMEESDIFGVQNPETGELGFISLMGMAEEHFAVAVYQGAEALYGFWDLESSEMMANPQQILEIPQLQASFEDRDMLEKKDRDLIKQLGLKFRGAHSWPMFRSYRPGFLPWYVTKAEARFLIHAMDQTLDVAPRVKENPDILYAGGDEDDDLYLVRAAHQQADHLVWEDKMMHVKRPEPTSTAAAAVVLDTEIIEQLGKTPRLNFILEVDLLQMPTPISEKGERPYLPYMLMLADNRSGAILGFELMKPGNSVSEMRAEVPMKVADFLAQAGGVPIEIIVRSELLFNMLNSLAEALRIKLRRSEYLPSIEAAADWMFGRMLGGAF